MIKNDKIKVEEWRNKESQVRKNGMPRDDGGGY